MEIKPAFQTVDPSKLSLQLIDNYNMSRAKLLNFYKLYCKSEDEVFTHTKGVDANLVKILKEQYSFPTLKMIYSKSDEEGNIKIGFQTADNHLIETVLLRRESETSICISTQIGCKMNCAFCATGHLGYKRDLELWEMIEQVRLTVIHHLKKDQRLSHITIMGMGEPFENFENMYNAFLFFINTFSYSIAHHKVTIASAGYLPGLKKLLDKKIRPSLALSLHAPNQSLREKLMPISKAFPISELIEFIKSYPLRSNKLISIQYVFLQGVNDKKEHAQELAELLQGLPVRLNFLKYNPVDYLPFSPSSEEVRTYFINHLRSFKISCIRRKSAGESIKGACGQLGFEQLKPFQNEACFQ